MSWFTKQKQTCRYQKQTYGYQSGEGRNKSWAGDEYMHTPVYKIDNQQGATCIAQGTQHSVIIYMRIESRKKICICVIESLCYTPEASATL